LFYHTLTFCLIFKIHEPHIQKKSISFDFMKVYLWCFFVLSLLLSSQTNWAQKKTTQFILKDSLQNEISLKNIKNLEALNTELDLAGYYYFNIDSKKQDSIETYTIELGTKTSVIAIQNIPKNIQQLFKTKSKICYTTPNEVSKWIGKVCDNFDRQGKNFAEIQLINQTAKNDTLFCELKVCPSKKRHIDKTVVKIYERFSKRFLKQYIKSSKPFSKAFLNTTEDKIKQLSFVKNKKPPAVLFTKDSTYLYLYLDKIKTNKLDALLGFSNQAGQTKIQFNGYIDLSLTNTLHKGETFAFKWNNTGQDQQEIEVLMDNPYIFNSPININYKLNLFRRDSTFVNTNHKLTLSYKPHYKHIINTYYHTESSAVVTTNNDNIVSYKKNIVGAEYAYKELNSFGNPKTMIKIDFGLGSKNTDAERTKQQNFSSDYIYVIEATPIHHLYIENRNAYLKSSSKNNNELFRIGGATTMRGFLEQSIVAHLYNYTNIEYRYFTNINSYLYAFSDVGYFKHLSKEDNLLSFGLGYTLGIPSGLMKISYAAGKNQNTSFNLNKGLFHINFVTIF